MLDVLCNSVGRDYKNKSPSVGIGQQEAVSKMTNQWAFPRDSYHPTVIASCMEWFGSFNLSDLLDTIEALNSGSFPKSIRTLTIIPPTPQSASFVSVGVA